MRNIVAAPPEEWWRLVSAHVLVTIAGLDMLSARGRAYVRALRASGWRGEAELYEAWRAPCLLPQQARQLQGKQGDVGCGGRGWRRESRASRHGCMEAEPRPIFNTPSMSQINPIPHGNSRSMTSSLDPLIQPAKSPAQETSYRHAMVARTIDLDLSGEPPSNLRTRAHENYQNGTLSSRGSLCSR